MMALFKIYEEPKDGKKIEMKNGKLVVPDNPIIPIIYGDGSGPDCSKTGTMVLDAAVKKAYGGKRKIVWFPVEAGKEAFDKRGEWMPADTTAAIKHYLVSMKGPLETPVGGGIRSLNVALRQECDLYCCVRPVRWFKGVPNPVKEPEKLDVVVFRENTEDVYAGIEWKQGTPEVQKVIDFLATQMGKKVRADSGIGIKPMSVTGTKRLVRAAINYALLNKRRQVTMMHKGNIMKFTEGAFREWGYEVAKEFGDKVITEQEVTEKYAGKKPEGKLLINDRIADSMFQQILLRPDEYDVIATPNLNGDYISDAAAAQVGGLGIAPGGNINYDTGLAVFEATHGTAPKYAGQDKVNPGSFILSGVMMLEYLGWKEAAAMVIKGFEKAIEGKRVTYDFARQMEGATEVKSSEFGQEIIKRM